MRRRILENQAGGVIKDPALATPLSVVFANKNNEEITIVEGEKWWSGYPSSTYEPIGIVVIPGEHGVLKDGSGTYNHCGVMSIVPMSFDTPEVGATSVFRMYWGYNSLDITGKSDGLSRYDSISNGLINYQKVACDTASDTNNSTGLSSDYYAYIPCQTSIGHKPTQGASPYAPSPYKGDDLMSGAYNEAYGTTNFDSDEPNKNALADFKGIQNTKIITDLATAEDWKNLSSLSNKNAYGYYPAACCCARFHTTGTKAFKDCTNEELKKGVGFWYLPSFGELGYIIPRAADISDTISKLNKAYGVGVQLNARYWSSSEYGLKNARNVYRDNGFVCNSDKDTNSSVRAFLRLGRVSD